MEVMENCGPAINQFSGTSIGIELHNRQFSVHTPNNLVNVNPVCCALGLGLGKDYIQPWQTFIFQFDSQLRDFSYVISCEIMRGVFRHLQRQGGLAK